MSKIQEIKELIEKAQVQIELFEAIQYSTNSSVHQDAVEVLVKSIQYLSNYLEELTGLGVWICCGGKVLNYDESCSICGDRYKEHIHENQ